MIRPTLQPGFAIHRTSRAALRLWLLCIAAVLGAQSMASGHVHHDELPSDVEASCTLCTLQATPAAVGPTEWPTVAPAPQTLVTPKNWAPAPLLRIAAPLPRGPPHPLPA